MESNNEQWIIPVTNITRITAKAMLPPSYQPSSRPYENAKRRSTNSLWRAREQARRR